MIAVNRCVRAGEPVSGLSPVVVPVGHIRVIQRVNPNMVITTSKCYNTISGNSGNHEGEGNAAVAAAAAIADSSSVVAAFAPGGGGRTRSNSEPAAVRSNP